MPQQPIALLQLQAQRPRRGWRPACLAAALACALAPQSASPQGGDATARQPETSLATRLPTLGETQAWSLGREKRLGQTLLADLYRAQAVVDDWVFDDYLAALWAPLFDSAQRQGLLNAALAQRFDWRLLTINDSAVNAFAMPGGLLGVNLGLFAVADSPGQLAAVLAHELSHVAQRHLARLLERQSQIAPLALGATLLAVLAAGSGSGSGDAAQAAIVGSQAALAQSGINFTRDMEREADRIGQLIFDAAGFPSGEFAAMFNKLGESARLNDDGSFPYLRSHPLTHERLAEVLARTPTRLTSEGPLPRVWAEFIRARAQVQQTTRREDWQEWLDAAASSASPSWQRYRAALAAQRLGQHERAWQGLERLAAQADLPAAVQTLLRVDRMRLWAMSAAPLASEATVQSWVHEALSQPQRAAWLSAAALTTRWPTLQPTAVARLQGWLSQHGNDASAWTVLAQLRQAQGQPLRALRAQAESALARGNIDAALDLLRAAQDWSRAHPSDDPVEAQVIWSRERALRQLQREWLEADRDAS